MAGASKHKIEDPAFFYNDNSTGNDGFLKLTPVGASAQETHKFFVAHPDRGVP
jgi:hypothetical protein